MSKVTHLTLDESGGLNRRRIHLREISGDVDAPLETVGQDLRAARLRRGDDLAAVSKALKICKDHLEAMEEDRLEALPGRAYAIGFVRSYADYLGLDPVVFVERFKREIAGRGEAPQPAVFVEDNDERRLPHGWAVIAVVMLGLVVYGAIRLASSADTLLNEPVAPVPASIAPHRAGAPAVAKKRPVPAAVTPAPSSQATAMPSAAAPTGIATVTGQANNPDTGQTAAAPVPPPPPQGRVYGERNGNARVVLHVLRPTRVLVQARDGTVYINRTLDAGDIYRVPNRVGLSLTTPDSGAVEFELDGQEMGAAGRPRQMAEAMSLDPQAIADRYTGQGGR